MKKKIAIFLPAPYKGRSFQGAKNLIKAIKLGSKKTDDDIDIVFSCVENTYDIKEDFKDLLSYDVEIRETRWQMLSKDEASRILEFAQIFDNKLIYENYVYPNDSLTNFFDCDFWLVVSDRTGSPLLPIKPYGMVVYDYIQRYIPEIFNYDPNIDLPYIYSARDAKVVYCTTPQTKEDAIQYAGISAKKIELAPMEFNPLNYDKKEYFDKKFDYIIWPSNSTQHKNHINALKGLKKYYEELDGKFKIILTGTQTEMFQKKSFVQIPYIVKVREMIEKNSILKKNISILGELSEEDYINVVSDAKFLFHPVLYDNGTFAVVEAAYYKIPSLVNGYPQMKYMNERFKLNMSFFDGNNPDDIAKSLKEFEKTSEEKKRELPDREFLNSFTYDNLADENWKLIRKYL